MAELQGVYCSSLYHSKEDLRHCMQQCRMHPNVHTTSCCAPLPALCRVVLCCAAWPMQASSSWQGWAL